MENEIKLVCGESIDEVVDMLLKEKENGNHVFCSFNDVILYSDDVTLDSAYMSICGCTKSDFIKKTRTHSNVSEKDNKPAKTDEKLVQELFEANAENAVRDMKMSKLLFLTKGGKFYSMIADEYIEKMSKYTVYCKEEEKDNWTQTIKSLIYHAGEVSDDYILRELRSKEYAGIIMEKLANGCTIDEIKQIVADQGHTVFTISLLGQNMIEYSPDGLDFVEQVIGTYATNSKTELCKVYKKELKRRKSLNKISLNENND